MGNKLDNLLCIVNSLIPGCWNFSLGTTDGAVVFVGFLLATDFAYIWHCGNPKYFRSRPNGRLRSTKISAKLGCAHPRPQNRIPIDFVGYTWISLLPLWKEV